MYRASPADYLIRLEGLPELRASIDPMGMSIDCASRHVSWRRVPEDIGGALGLSPGDPVCVIRCLWASAGSPVAYSATYLSEGQSFLAGAPPVLPDVLRTSQFTPPACGYSAVPDADRPTMPVPRPAGMYLELQPPAPSVARTLRLAAGEPAVDVTVRFDDASAGVPMALTTAVLRPERFRVVIESPDGPRAAAVAVGDDGIWSRAARNSSLDGPGVASGGPPYRDQPRPEEHAWKSPPCYTS